MSVRKFWVAGDPHSAAEFTAETTQNAVEPVGAVHRDSAGSALEPSSLTEGIITTLRIRLDMLTLHR